MPEKRGFDFFTAVLIGFGVWLFFSVLGELVAENPSWPEAPAEWFGRLVGLAIGGIILGALIYAPVAIWRKVKGGKEGN